MGDWPPRGILNLTTHPSLLPLLICLEPRPLQPLPEWCPSALLPLRAVLPTTPGCAMRPQPHISLPTSELKHSLQSTWRSLALSQHPAAFSISPADALPSSVPSPAALRLPEQAWPASALGCRPHGFALRSGRLCLPRAGTADPCT